MMTATQGDGLDELQAALCGLQIDADALADQVRGRVDLPVSVRKAFDDVRFSLWMAHEIVCDAACQPAHPRLIARSDA